MKGREGYAFPGVGVRFSGAEAAFADRYPSVRARLGPLAAALTTGTDTLGDLDAQRFAYTFGAAVAEALGGEPACTVGYSLGMYAAVVAAGALSFEDGLRCVDAADAAMRAACPDGGALGVVVGYGRDELPLRGAVVVNQNDDTTLVIAGTADEVEATLAASEAALKVVRLRAELPYHHPCLAPAVAPFRAFLGTLDWRAPRCPVVSCIDQSRLTTVDTLADHLAQNLATPLHWQATVLALGVDRVVECGAGLSLTQSARLVAGAPKFVSLKGLG